MFQKHEFVERVVPLHQKDPVGSGATQIFVAVVGISANATFTTPLRIVDLKIEDLQLDVRKIPRILAYTEPKLNSLYFII